MAGRCLTITPSIIRLQYWISLLCCVIISHPAVICDGPHSMLVSCSNISSQKVSSDIWYGLLLWCVLPFVIPTWFYTRRKFYPVCNVTLHLALQSSSATSRGLSVCNVCGIAYLEGSILARTMQARAVMMRFVSHVISCLMVRLYIVIDMLPDITTCGILNPMLSWQVRWLHDYEKRTVCHDRRA